MFLCNLRCRELQQKCNRIVHTMMSYSKMIKSNSLPFARNSFKWNSFKRFPEFERKQDLLGSLLYNLLFKNVIDYIALTGKFIYWDVILFCSQLKLAPAFYYTNNYTMNTLFIQIYERLYLNNVNVTKWKPIRSIDSHQNSLF